MDEQTLDELRQRALEAGKKITPPADVPPPTLQDIRAQALASVERNDPVIKKQLFDQRQQRMRQPIDPKTGQAAAAVAAGGIAGLVKGLFSPVSAFMPDAFNDQIDMWQEDSVRKLSGMMAKSQYKAAYAASPIDLAYAPGTVGEFAGSVAPFIGTYGVARDLFQVPKALSFSSKVGRSVLAATATGGVLSAGAKLDPGESRWAKVAMDSVAMGAFEMVGIPSMMKAWKEESPLLAEKIVGKVTVPDWQVSPATAPTPPSNPERRALFETVGRAFKSPSEDTKKIEGQLTAIRAGVPADPQVVDAVLDQAKKDPELAKTPIVLQASKQKEATERVNSPATTIDPILAMGDDNPVRVTVNVDGQPAIVRDIRRDPTNPQHFQNEVNKFKSEVEMLTNSGQDVKVADVTGGSQEDVNSVLATLQGKNTAVPSADKKRRKVPGAAPPSSIAENGVMPPEGTKVNIVEPDKPVVQATVVASPEMSAEDKAVFDPLKAYVEYYRTRRMEMRRPTASQAQKLHELYTAVQKAYQDPEIGMQAYRQLSAGTPYSLNTVIEQMEGGAPIRIVGGGAHPPAIPSKVQEVAKKARRKSTPTTPDELIEEYLRMKDASVDAPRFGPTVQLPDGSVREVPLSQLQLPLAGGTKQTTELKPHLDGSTRNGIIHLDTGEVSYEPLGASQLPEHNNFRTELFGSVNNSAPFGQDPRLFIHDNAITISVPQLQDGAEMVTQRRAAKVLMSNGVDPHTTVNIALAQGGVYTPDNKIVTATLEDLAKLQLPIADMQLLQDNAAARGLTAVPFGNKVVLRSRSGFSRTFENSMEAHEAVQRMPHGQSGTKIEGLLEREWRMGSENAYDPDVDVTHFLPIAQQEKGIQEVLGGSRPLTLVYTKDSNALTTTIRQLEQSMQLPENSLKVQLLPAMDRNGRSAAAIYSENAVALQAAKFRDVLNYSGVTARDPAGIVRQLSAKGQGHGIYILAGRDAESAALYARYRDTGQRELWQKGRIEQDTLGPYRRFSREQKQTVSYPGAGDEQYINVDLADSMEPPKGVSFAADSGDKPRMAEEMAAYEPDGPRWDAKNPPTGEYYDVSGPMSKIFGNRFRPMMELSKDLEVRTGVPFYNWYRSIEVGRNKVEQVTNPILVGVRDLAKRLTRQERQQVQLLFEARIAGLDSTAALEKSLSPAVHEAAAKLKDVYTSFFTSEGFTEPEIRDFFNIFPNLRKADGDFKYAIQGRSSVPRLGMLLSKDLQNGVIHIDARELDFQRIANRLIRSTATERYLQPSWSRVSTELEAFSQAKRIPSDYSDMFMRYMQEVLHMPDSMHVSLSRGFKQLFGKLGMRMSDIEAQDAVSMGVQMNYFSNLGWQPGQVLRNALQTLQTSAPIIGMSDWFTGWRFGQKWWKDPKLQADMVRRGIVQPEGIYAPLQEVRRLLEGGGGKVSGALDVFFNQGTRWHANVDDFNKVVAYWGQYQRALRVGKEHLEGKINWPAFVEKSKLDMRDAVNGPFVQEVKGLMARGNLEAAASRMGEEFAKSTQFLYTRGNAPYVMQSTLGRFFLQYGTWPMWYAENLRNIAMRGSTKNRLAAAGRWVGIQSGMFLTAQEVFGIDMARWLFFSPLGYTGGPFAQMAIQGAETWKSAVDPSSNDPIARIAKARLLNNSLRQIAPFPTGAATNLFKTISEINSGRWQDAARQIFGMPPSKKSIFQ